MTHAAMPVVYRQLAFPLAVFDYIKVTQRKLQATTGQTLTLNQVITAIAMEHKHLTEERGVRNEPDQNQTATRGN